MIPESVIRSHDAHTRLAASDCPGELERDDSGTWTCQRVGCSFRAVARGGEPVIAGTYVDGRHDPAESESAPF